MDTDNTQVKNTHTSILQQDAMSSIALFRPDIQSEQTELVYTQAPIALGSALAVALLITGGLWNIADPVALLVWLGAQFLQTLGRIVLVVRYRRLRDEGRNDPRWAHYYLSGTLISGLVWGSLGLFIDLTWPLEYQTILLMGFAGIVAGAISSYAALMPVYIAFLVPAFVIPSQALLIQAEKTPNTMGLLLLVFAGAMLVIARNYNRNVVRSLRLRHENSDLIRKMTATNAALEVEIQERQGAEKELGRERRLFTRGPVTVFRWSVEEGWPIEYVSKTVAQFGYDEEYLIQDRTPFASLIVESDLQRVEQAKLSGDDDRFVASGVDYRIVRADGEIRWVYDYTIPIRDDTGEIAHYAGYLLDITGRKQAEFDLQQEKERAQVTLHSIGDAVITTDVNGQVEYLNPMAEQLTGWENSIARGLPLRRVFSLFDEASKGNIEAPVIQSLRTGNASRSTRDQTLRRHDGRQMSIQYSTSPIMSYGQEPLGAVLVFHDVTENRSMARQLTYQAMHDPLTGLINRHEFEDRLGQALDSAMDQNENHALCFMDLDQFKIVNDTCSHSAGDAMLKYIAGLLKGCLRETDILARLGGDEFAVLLKNCPVADAAEIAGSMLARINVSRFDGCGQSLEVGASIGIVPIEPGTESVTSVMKAADLACYAAKDLGGNRIHIYQASDQGLARRHDEMQWVSRLAEAIESDHLVLYYQDIVPVVPDSGTEHHFEVLVRMLDKAGELVMPAEFMPAAERYNLAVALDHWVIDHSFSWYATRGERLTMSINLSGASINDTSQLEFIKTSLARYRIPPDTVCFEVTETAAIANLEMAVGFIRELRELGCHFALDDFGSGLSSFAYLKHLPVSYLKIDGAFVRDMDTDPVNIAMVNAINQLGSVLGIKTIAEFVENDRILEKLSEIGVDYAQGYGVAKPMPLEGMRVAGQQTA